MEPRNTWREPRNTWRALQTAGLERIPISLAEHSKAKWGVENLLSTSGAPAAPGLQQLLGSSWNSQTGPS